MKQLGLCAVLAVGVAACAQVVPGNHYTVYIDPAFTQGERAALIDGLQDWTSKVPVTYDVFIQGCSGFDNGVICTHRSDAAGVIAHGKNSHYLGVTGTNLGSGSRGDSGGMQGKDGGDVWLDMPLIYAQVDKYPNLLSQTFNHEVGHAMGLNHHNTHALMFPSTGG